MPTVDPCISLPVGFMRSFRPMADNQIAGRGRPRGSSSISSSSPTRLDVVGPLLANIHQWSANLKHVRRISFPLIAATSPRLERRGEHGQHETEKPDHPASSGDFATSSTRTRFSVGTPRGNVPGRSARLLSRRYAQGPAFQTGEGPARSALAGGARRRRCQAIAAGPVCPAGREVRPAPRARAGVADALRGERGKVERGILAF
jgi:hypothetical protein